MGGRWRALSRVLSSLWSKPGFCFPVPRHIAMEVVSRVGPEPWGWLLLCGCPWARDSSFCGEPWLQAASRQQSPGTREFWSSSYVGTGPGVTHSAGSVPQLMLSRAWLCAPGAVHMDGHMLVWAPLGHGPTFLGTQKECMWAHHSTPSSLAAAACPSTWHGLATPAPRWHELPWVLSAQHTPACSNLGPTQRFYGAFSDP